MPARSGIDHTRVIDAAVELADREGLQAVGLTRLARELGIKPPSIYNHVRGQDGIYQGMALRGVTELSRAMEQAAVGKAGPDAVRSMASAFRDFAHRHPGLYLATLRAPDDSEPELVAAVEHLLGVLKAVMSAWNLNGSDAIHAIRGLRSLIHGFVSLELAGGFGLSEERDESFRRLVDLFIRGIA